LATAIILSGVSLGTVAGVPAGALVSEWLGWRSAFGMAAAVAVPVLIAVLILVPRLPATSTRGLGDLAEVLKIGKVQFGLAGTVLAFVGQFAGYTFITPFMLQVVHIDAVTISAVLLGFGATGLAGNMLGGWMVGKGAYRALMATLLLLGVSVLLLKLFGNQPIPAIALILVWGLGFGLLPIVMQSWLFSVVPERIESVQAIFVSAAQASIGSGALVGGLMVDHFGTDSALWLAAATAFATAILIAVRR
jgi:predicted MFS family arabinose efflux permease